MPKRDVTVISHAVLTNHRIVRATDEPFPEVAFHMTTPELPDLVLLSAKPGSHSVPDPLVQLQAYRQIMLAHPEYRERYWKLGKQLETTHPNEISVLEALADMSSQDKSHTGQTLAIGYLERARVQGTTQPADFEELGRLLMANHQPEKAIAALQDGISRVPFDEELYRLLTQSYVSTKDIKACKTAATALDLFPQDDSLRAFVKNQCSLH